MIRILLTYVAPLVLPFVGWILWRRLSRSAQHPSQSMREAPWHWLGLAGVVLVAVTLGSIALFTGGTPGEVYQPPRVVDGEVLPGRHRPAAPRD